MRVDFQFDKAAFAFNALPFKLPYPVPFKLLGDETKVVVLQSVMLPEPCAATLLQGLVRFSSHSSDSFFAF